MRTRKARLPDAPRIHELIGIYSHQTILLPRSLDEICENIHNFTVAVEAGRVVGCGGLHFYGPSLAEVRSIAVDPRFVPLGAPVYLATTRPNSDVPLERLVIAQDTGGAIRGAVRADFYWGTGNEAGALAGRMRQRGRMWILWPRGETLPRF